jgi:hypothetical protein
VPPPEQTQPPNPITDSEGTPPTTNQEPVDPSTGTELSVPTTSETITDLPIQSFKRGPPDIGLIIGIVVIIVIVTVSVVTVMAVIAILLKKRHGKFTTIAVPTAANQAYGLNTHKGVEESIYTYPGPEMGVDNTTEVKQNVAYVTMTDVIVEVNEA